MALDRRRFLGALALLPAATAAGCAGRGASRAGDGPKVPAPPAADAAAGGEGGPLAAVRGFPLGDETEPAPVFRAAAARPGEP